MVTQPQKPTQYVICIFNGQNPVSLQKRKLYRVAARESNDPEHYIRIIDEDDEDYLYPREWFVAAPLPQDVLAAVESA